MSQAQTLATTRMLAIAGGSMEAVMASMAAATEGTVGTDTAPAESAS